MGFGSGVPGGLSRQTGCEAIAVRIERIMQNCDTRLALICHDSRFARSVQKHYCRQVVSVFLKPINFTLDVERL